MQLAFGNGGDGNVTHIGHAGQGFASKPHRFNRLQIFKLRQLGRHTRIPWPSSDTWMSLRPPSLTTTLMEVEPA
ncbi:hypothetical protein U1Q18_036918, partial [Sarracenia purpurea var. burkii]